MSVSRNVLVFVCTLGLLAAACTFLPQAFSSSGGYSNGGDALFRRIGAYLAPDDAPPVRKEVPPQGGS